MVDVNAMKSIVYNPFFVEGNRPDFSHFQNSAQVISL